MHYPFALPALPYAPNALSPYIDEQTVTLHHDRHFAAYIDKLNALLRNAPRYQSWSLEQLILGARFLPAQLRAGILQNAGGAYNHGLYFRGMTPPEDCAPQDTALQRAILAKWGDLRALQSNFLRGAQDRLGSGWMWLALDRKGELMLLSTCNQDTLLSLRMFPILCCDVWEHAYYLQYYNRRDHAVIAWWHLIDWQRANAVYRAAKKGAWTVE